MISSLRAFRPLGVRASVLLVLAVLTGLLAMHALGPAAMFHSERATPPVSSHAVAMSSHSGHRPAYATAACHHRADGHGKGHGNGNGNGGHLDHADSACAASGISGGPDLSAPAPERTVAADFPVCHGEDAAAPSVERAPPSLSQLQLLRI